MSGMDGLVTGMYNHEFIPLSFLGTIVTIATTTEKVTCVFSLYLVIDYSNTTVGLCAATKLQNHQPLAPLLLKSK